MDFKEALKKVYETRNSDDELGEPFLVCSRVADLIGNSYEEKKKLSVFFAVEKRLRLLSLLCELPPESVDATRQQYDTVCDLLSKNAFNRLIDLLIDIIGIVTPAMDEEFYEPYDGEKDEDLSGSGAIVYNGETGNNGETENAAGLPPEAQTSQIAQTAMSSGQQVSQSVSGGASPTASRNTSASYGNQSTYDYGGSGVKRGICIFLLSLNVFLLTLFGVGEMPWHAYRWIIGLASSVMILSGGILLSDIMDDVLFNGEIFDTIALGAAVIANLILFFVFGDNYNVICYWVSAALLIMGICAAQRSFDFASDVCGWIDVVECVLTVATVVLNIFL